MGRRFYIIGAGPGAGEFLTAYAKEKIKQSEEVLAASSRIALVYEGADAYPYTGLAEAVKKSKAGTVSVLVSGDVGFFSAAQELHDELRQYGEVELVCGISSMQYFFAKAGVPYEAVKVKSMHGREGSVLGAVSYNKKVFVLTGGRYSASYIVNELCEAGLGGLTVRIGENLGSESERIETGEAWRFRDKALGRLTVLLIENENAADPDEPLRDNMFKRVNGIPMTKEEIRWVSVAKLSVKSTDTVWDVGAGTGSIGLELARKAYDGVVYAVELDTEAVKLLKENRKKLGGYNVRIIEGRAPEAFEELPKPDRVFIGGSHGKMRLILEKIKEKNPKARVVINAVTMETLFEAHRAMRELGYTDVDIIQLSVSRGSPAGSYTMLRAVNPVFIISGGAQSEA